MIARLFSLQVLAGEEYEQKLIDQHYTKSSLEAERWNIFVTDKSGENIQLTENIDLYDVYVDPSMVVDKQWMIDDLAPLIYSHLCELHELAEPTQTECVQNLERFLWEEIFPKREYSFYQVLDDAENASWSVLTGTLIGTGLQTDIPEQEIVGAFGDELNYWEQLASILETATPEWVFERIVEWLDEKILIGKKPTNYIDDFSDRRPIIDAFLEADLPYVSVIQEAFVSVIPEKVTSVYEATEALYAILWDMWVDSDWGDWYTRDYIETKLVTPQENRYVNLVSNLNVKYIDTIRTLKQTYREDRYELKANKRIYSSIIRSINAWNYDNISTTYLKQETHDTINNARNTDAIYTIGIEDILPEIVATADVDIPLYPRFHGLWFDKTQRRYYPYDSFASNIVGYVDVQWSSLYGIEEYFEKELSGEDGRIVWLATPWIWQIWSNNIIVEKPVDWEDVYLTIDPIIQKELESISKRFYNSLYADSIAITILDPTTWHVKSLTNYPTFNPNEYADAYKLKPVTWAQRYLVDDESRIDIPLFALSGTQLLPVTADQRQDLSIKKYFFENLLWPQVFVDKNISYPYEPGSVFKSITLGIGIDSDALGLYEYHNDPGEVDIWKFKIANISNICTWTHTFLHALAYSCNVGMVRMAQKILKYSFYSYLDRLGFGHSTGIELANEWVAPLPDFNSVSTAWFFTNTYGQGILATPLQVAAAYGALVNGWRYIQPTIVQAIYNKQKSRFVELSESPKKKVFKTTTSDELKTALVHVVNRGNLKGEIGIPGIALWGKTWTSEIAYKWDYRSGKWRTNGSFVGVVSARDVKHVVSIQVRRPRSSQRWLDTAWKVFQEVADFLVAYEQIER